MDISDQFCLQDLLEKDFFTQISRGNHNRNFYPSFRARSRWEAVLKKFPPAKEILSAAEEINRSPIPALPYSTYCDYQKNGSRVTYENPYFRRRRQLQILTAAMCLSGDKEKYMAKILDHITAILEEWTWTVPAHAARTESGSPEIAFRFTDLFCSETGTVLALTVLLIGPELEEAFPGVCDWIRQETLQRTNYNVLDNPDRHWWFKDPDPQNWSIWCSFNNLFIALVLENDAQKRTQTVKAFLDLVNHYSVNYEEDGFCMEGPMYYTKSGLMLFRVLDLLEKAVPGCAGKIFVHKKIRSILQFIADVHVAGPMVASFGDAKPILNSTMGGILGAGKAICSPELLSLSRFRKKEQLYSNGVCGDLLSELLILFFDLDPGKIELEQNSFSLPATTFFKDHLGICRTRGFSAFIKAGHNGEPHNHNDLGHFAVYAGETPVIVDAGTGTYSKRNFGPDRYTLWYTRGSGHNAPVIGGMEQQPGKEFKASLCRKGDNAFVCDLTNAYPETAGLQSFIRTLETTESLVTLEDSLESVSTTERSYTLLTPQNVQFLSNGDLLLGSTLLHPEGVHYTGQSSCEDLSSRENQSNWDTPLTALYFSAKGSKCKFIFTEKPQ